MYALQKVTIRTLLACALPFTGLAAVTAAGPAAAAPRSLPSATSLATYESTVLTAINWQRRNNGRPPVALSSCADRYAESLASKLRSSATLLHQSMSTVMRGCQGTRAAENIARGQVDPKQVLALWMSSPGHRANVLDARLTHVGIGTTYASNLGYTTVATFIRP